MEKVVSVHWFRKGLRLHDNPAFFEACRNSSRVYPLFILDPHFSDPNKVGVNRYNFLLESLHDLHSSLLSFGSRLYIIQGNPEIQIPKLLDEWKFQKFTFEGDSSPFSKKRDKQIVNFLSKNRVNVSIHQTHTLFDLELYVTKCETKKQSIPNSYQSFLKLFDSCGIPRTPFPSPFDPSTGAESNPYLQHPIPSVPLEDLQNSQYNIPSLQEMGYALDPFTQPTTSFHGGEREALNRLHRTVQERARWVRNFEKPETSPNSLEPSTTVLSPHLKFGTLSVSTFYHALREILEQGERYSPPPTPPSLPSPSLPPSISSSPFSSSSISLDLLPTPLPSSSSSTTTTTPTTTTTTSTTSSTSSSSSSSSPITTRTKRNRPNNNNQSLHPVSSDKKPISLIESEDEDNENKEEEEGQREEEKEGEGEGRGLRKTRKKALKTASLDEMWRVTETTTIASSNKMTSRSTRLTSQPNSSTIPEFPSFSKGTKINKSTLSILSPQESTLISSSSSSSTSSSSSSSSSSFSSTLSPSLLLSPSTHPIRSSSSSSSSHSLPPVSLVGQLLWREFFYLSSYTTPHFSSIQGNPLCRPIPWNSPPNQIYLDAFKHAKTGYPFIDALLIQLRLEGWIHHLGRHALACFLTRGDLWESWEEGAKIFNYYLLDADYALNNANWQWLSASRYFHQYYRVYSPIVFGKKTDPNGEFIKKYLPQLRNYPPKYIYSPWLATLAQQREWGCLIEHEESSTPLTSSLSSPSAPSSSSSSSSSSIAHATSSLSFQTSKQKQTNSKSLKSIFQASSSSSLSPSSSSSSSSSSSLKLPSYPPPIVDHEIVSKRNMERMKLAYSK